MTDIIDLANRLCMRLRIERATSCDCERCGDSFPAAALRAPHNYSKDLWCAGCIEHVAEVQERLESEDYYGGASVGSYGGGGL